MPSSSAAGCASACLRPAPRPLIGSVVGLEPSAVLLQGQNGAAPTRVPLGPTTTIEVSGGRRSKAGRGAVLGAAFGGLLLDHISIAATLIGGTILLALASLIVGNGDRIGRVHPAEKGFNADTLGTPEQLYKKPQYTT